MREEAFAEFHQVCYVVSQAFWFCFLPLFGGMLFENAKGACRYNLKLTLL